MNEYTVFLQKEFNVTEGCHVVVKAESLEEAKEQAIEKEKRGDLRDSWKRILVCSLEPKVSKVLEKTVSVRQVFP